MSHAPRKILIRGLPAEMDEAAVQAMLEANQFIAQAKTESRRPRVLWFEKGVLPEPTRGSAGAPAWCSVLAPDDRTSEVVAGIFDGITLPKGLVPCSVELAPHQDAALRSNAGRFDSVVDPDADTYLHDQRFVDFLTESERQAAALVDTDVVRGISGIADDLAQWLEKHTAQQAHLKTAGTALVEAVVQNWFYGVAFPWEVAKEAKFKKHRKCAKAGDHNTDSDEECSPSAADLRRARRRLARHKTLTVEQQVLKDDAKRQDKLKRDRLKEERRRQKENRKAAKARKAAEAAATSASTAPPKQAPGGVQKAAVRNKAQPPPKPQASPLPTAPPPPSAAAGSSGVGVIGDTKAAGSTFTVSSARDTAKKAKATHADPAAPPASAPKLAFAKRPPSGAAAPP